MGRLCLDSSCTSSAYCCANCGALIAARDELVSRSFHGRSGPAYLFIATHNTRMGALEDRSLMTGMHVVADVHCLVCAAYVGWAYLYAAELGQRYKQGKAVLERACLRRAGGESAGSDDEPDA